MKRNKKISFGSAKFYEFIFMLVLILIEKEIFPTRKIETKKNGKRKFLLHKIMCSIMKKEIAKLLNNEVITTYCFSKDFFLRFLPSLELKTDFTEWKYV